MENKNKKKQSPILRAAKVFSVFLIILALLAVLVFCTFFSRTETSNYDALAKKPDFTFSGLFDGSYVQGLIDYYTDTVHNRDAIKEIYAYIKDLFGTGENDEHVIHRDPGDESEESDPFADFSLDPSMAEQSEESDPSEEPGESSEEPTYSDPEVSDPDVSGETSKEEPGPGPDPHSNIDAEISGDALIMNYNGHAFALELYGGDPNQKVIPKYCETLNNFAEKVKSLGVTVISMPVPKPAAYYLQYTKDYQNKAGNVKRDLDAIKAGLSGVVFVETYDALLPHISEHIYFRTDYHWTALGAYYGAEQLAKQLGLPFASLKDGYTEYKRTGYLGTMYNVSGKSTKLLNDTEEFVWYDPTSDYTSTSFEGNSFSGGFSHSLIWKTSEEKPASWYYTFLGGDGYLSHTISNEVKNGRKVLVVKDSYGNALVPFLTYSFEEILVVDARTFKENLTSFIRKNGITDILFVNSIHSSVSSAYVKYLMNLCQ